MTKFHSRASTLIMAQITFVLLAYSLLQTFLRKLSRGEMNAKTRQRILNELLWENDRLVLYSANRFAYFRPIDYQQLLLEMPEGSRRRILARTKEVRENLLRTARRALPLEEEWKHPSRNPGPTPPCPRGPGARNRPRGGAKNPCDPSPRSESLDPEDGNLSPSRRRCRVTGSGS